jgi:hypothetical protein
MSEFGVRRSPPGLHLQFEQRQRFQGVHHRSHSVRGATVWLTAAGGSVQIRCCQGCGKRHSRTPPVAAES